MRLRKKDENVFSQFIAIMSRKRFAVQGLAEKFGVEYRKEGFRSWDHLVLMVFAQIAHLSSLRSITCAVNIVDDRFRTLGLTAQPHRSTLAYANEHRDWRFFRAVFDLLLAEVQTELGRRGISQRLAFTDRAVYMFDSTTVDLCHTVYDWALYRTSKGAMKIHMGCSPDYLPVMAVVTPGRRHDVQVLEDEVDGWPAVAGEGTAGGGTVVGDGTAAGDGEDLSPAVEAGGFPRGAVLLFDRGYVSYRLFAKLRARGIHFVTRAKSQMSYRVVRSLPVRKDAEPACPGAAEVVRDQIIAFVAPKAAEDCPHHLRLVTAVDRETGKEYRFLSDLLEDPPEVISALYKARWTIELFFKFIKQNGMVRGFVGTSENAVKTQVWAALISIMLARHLQIIARAAWCFSGLVEVIRTNLFTFFSLQDMLDYCTHEREPPPAAGLFAHLLQ